MNGPDRRCALPVMGGANGIAAVPGGETAFLAAAMTTDSAAVVKAGWRNAGSSGLWPTTAVRIGGVWG